MFLKSLSDCTSVGDSMKLKGEWEYFFEGWVWFKVKIKGVMALN